MDFRAPLSLSPIASVMVLKAQKQLIKGWVNEFLKRAFEQNIEAIFRMDYVELKNCEGLFPLLSNSSILDLFYVSSTYVEITNSNHPQSPEIINLYLLSL